MMVSMIRTSIVSRPFLVKQMDVGVPNYIPFLTWSNVAVWSLAPTPPYVIPPSLLIGVKFCQCLSSTLLWFMQRPNLIPFFLVCEQLLSHILFFYFLFILIFIKFFHLALEFSPRIYLKLTSAEFFFLIFSFISLELVKYEPE